jgi:hypothetical protein
MYLYKHWITINTTNIICDTIQLNYSVYIICNCYEKDGTMEGKFEFRIIGGSFGV